MAELQLAIEAGQGAAVSNEPLVVVLDEANTINWSAGAQAFIDAISGTDIHASVGGVACASVEEIITQTAGSRKLVAHVRVPTCADGTVLKLVSGAGTTTRNPTGVPRASAYIHTLLQNATAPDNYGTGGALTAGADITADPGQVAGAAGFHNSPGSYITAGKPATAGGFTVSGWFWLSAGVVNQNRALMGQAGALYGAGNTSWILLSWAYDLSFGVYNGVGSTNWSVSFGDIRGFSEGWHHFALCYVPGTGSFAFMDGAPVGTAQPAAVCQTSTLYDVTFGTKNSTEINTYRMGGFLDQIVMVVGDGFDATDVALHYRNEANNGAFWSEVEAAGIVRPRPVNLLRHGPRLVMGGVL